MPGAGDTMSLFVSGRGFVGGGNEDGTFLGDTLVGCGWV